VREGGGSWYLSTLQTISTFKKRQWLHS